MKLGVLQFFSWPERRVDLATVYARALERIEIMDRTGYDAVWLAEHHFSSFSVCPSVHMVGTLAAARTKRLRIGTAVSLAPFYHPLRLAEEVALLDLLSGGRVNWGAGRGFARVEFTAFGVPPEESVSRFHETVEIVLKAWTEAKLTFAGKHFHFEDVEVLPQTSAAAASAGMGGGEFEGGDRLGGRQRLSAAGDGVRRNAKPISLHPLGHPACGLALPALHVQLPRRRGSPCRARARHFLRNRSQLGAKVRTGDRAAVTGAPFPAERPLPDPAGPVGPSGRSGFPCGHTPERTPAREYTLIAGEFAARV